MNGSGWIGLFLFIFALAPSASPSENLTAHFIDVGQGDSILLQFKNKSLLIDGGPPEMGPRLEEYLRAQNVSRLDLLILTHPHDDHIGGLIAVLEDLPVNEAIDNGENDSSLIYKRFRALIDKKKNILCFGIRRSGDRPRSCPQDRGHLAAPGRYLQRGEAEPE